MSTSILELIRSTHELGELYESAIGLELNEHPSGQRAKVEQQLIISRCVDGIVKSNRELLDLYEDSDDLLQEELDKLNKSDAVVGFYDSLNAIREYHARLPQVLAPEAPTAVSMIPSIADLAFSGEEVWGKYIDMHELHAMYRNLPHLLSDSIDVDYPHYLEQFTCFENIPETCKTKGRAYSLYVESLGSYVLGFIARVQPLIDLSEMQIQWCKTFENKWHSNELTGWNSKSLSVPSSSARLDLMAFHQQSELNALGADRLKLALESRGLKCGGTLEDRAARLWAIRGLQDHEIPKKLLAKSLVRTDESSGAKPSSSTPSGLLIDADDHISEREKAPNTRFSNSRQELAWLEYRARSAADLIGDVVNATQRFVEKQSTRTAEEREQEREAEEQGMLPDMNELAKEEEEDSEPVYNPKNLPVGWDGKPIPFWMYKLHGLNITYTCEICGDESYQGRKAFDRHFREAKHARGMHLLGIPNSRHFHDITKINDALALHKKMQEVTSEHQRKAAEGEEFEDREGNVYHRAEHQL